MILTSILVIAQTKVRDACSITLAAFAGFVKTKGKSGVEAGKILGSLEQLHPRVFKKMQIAAGEGVILLQP